MKYFLFTGGLIMLLVCDLMGQGPVRDEEVVPVGMSLDQEIRFQVLKGGNIEFIFSTLSNYKNGVNAGGGGASIYETRFTITSTSNWELVYGAEDGNLIGVDDPANTIDLRHVGWSINENGNHSCGNELDCSQSWDGTGVQGLDPFPFVMITNGSGNAGNASDNDFTIIWRAGTTEAPGPASTSMFSTSLLEQGAIPDRYLTTVLFDLRAL